MRPDLVFLSIEAKVTESLELMLYKTNYRRTEIRGPVRERAFCLIRSIQTGLGPHLHFLSNGYLGLRSWLKFCFSEFLAMDQAFSRRWHVIAFDALILHGIFVVYVVAHIWVKEGGETREWRKLHDEELNEMYCPPNIVRVIKSRGMR